MLIVLKLKVVVTVVVLVDMLADQIFITLFIQISIMKLMELFSLYQKILNLNASMIQQNLFDFLIKEAVQREQVLMYLKDMEVWMKEMKKLMILLN